MTYIATISSKRQFTIPAKLFRKLNFQEGEKVLVQEKNGTIAISRAKNVIKKLAGSVAVAQDKQGVDVDKAITLAKQKHFASKN